MATKKEVNKAFAELKHAKDQFAKAIKKFKSVYNPGGMDLDGWRESLDDDMFDLEQDIAACFDESDEEAEYPFANSTHTKD